MLAYGGGMRYVRDPRSGAAFVLDSKLVDDLKWADSRLVERDLHAFSAKEVTQFTVTSGERSRGFVREGEEGQEVWKDAAAPEGEGDETAGTWLGKLFRLRADRYLRDDDPLHPDEALAKTEPVPVLRVEVSAAEGAAGYLELSRVGEARDARWYAVTEQTRVRVAVSRHLSDEVTRDLEGLLPAD